MRSLLVLLAITRVAVAEPRSPRRAVAIGVAGTAVPVALIAASVYLGATDHDPARPDVRGAVAVGGGVVGSLALVFTPSLGRYYGERRWPQALTWIRLTGLLIAAGGVTVQGIEATTAHDCAQCKTGNIGWGIAAVGGATMLGASIYDVATAPAATERGNLGIAPLVGGHQVGLALAGRF